MKRGVFDRQMFPQIAGQVIYGMRFIPTGLIDAG